MTLGFIGRKCGMTSIFDETGGPVPVTVIEAASNRVTQVKTVNKDGYSAVQVSTGAVRASLLSKAEIGHFAKAGVIPGYGLWEFRIDAADEAKFTVGQEISVDMFKAGDIVAVSGISKGKGMAGVIKRWGFSKQRASHGNSLAHRAPGSIGQNQDPGRVPKGKKMAGHMGSEKVTIRKLEVVRVDNELKVLLIKGAVPGCNGGVLRIVPLV